MVKRLNMTFEELRRDPKYLRNSFRSLTLSKGDGIVDTYSEQGGFANLDGVEVFKTGQHREGSHEYTDSDLQQIVENFQKVSGGPNPLIRPPLVIGHEERQELTEESKVPELENTGTPAFGWISNLEKVGNKLLANVRNVPQWLAELIKAGSYDSVSSEIYDEPPPGVPGSGKMFRRLALLGGELPQIKDLKALSQTMRTGYSEQGSRSPNRQSLPTKLFTRIVERASGKFEKFSEVVPMDRAQLEQQALSLGLSQATIDGITDDAVLGGLVMDLMAKQSGMPTEPPPEPTPEAPVEGQMADAGLGAGTVVATPTPTAPAAPGGMPGGQPSQIIMKYSDVQALVTGAVNAALKDVRTDLQSTKEQTSQLTANTKRANITAFCEAMRGAGKILPAELDGGDPKKPTPTIVDRLMRADATRVVRKYSEGGKEIRQTELDLQMAEIESRPPLVTFAERVKGGKAGTAGAVNADAEVDKVKRFSEDRVPASHRTKFVTSFEEARKKKPELTAVAYGLPADYE